MRLRALAKINLGLDILRKREDGYHEVRMIMQTIQMYDVLEIRRVKKPGISLSVNYPYIPNDERNLVYKAAKLLMDEFQVKSGVDIRLEKFIPVAAGMAGGSSDAAAALVGINRLFKLGLSEKDLMDRAVNIGADVPYCVMRGTALAEGIGEKLTRITPVPDCFVLIGKPGINVSTKAAYESLQLDKITTHPDIDGMIKDIECGNLLAMTEKMGNVFEPGIIGKYPVIGEIKELMEAHGALKAMMSGSGPTVFGIFDDRKKMEAAAAALRESRLAKTVFATEVTKAGGRTNDK
ncbi:MULTISPECIES: 4-(cytidine 5'-diphospho)-2-C-methyl-D-erythritol kinase [unclassified Blautia]|uniref:4-(cytidine 5'-diphospho)-2-C-methyl-D-erythritol kinase n=1 Tax=unclassified Blautia TaxID=2648079 RepID=UPI001C0FE008|nr:MULTISPECIES: 4-(cytidine 5'-diphospho)-2-C-methyl-D-erythritol kinase [unclassified Blautia]MBU5681013.1 4-(cytidine 5'-diphospho)-2-C-methyl-D-erythritol kinase [Blautia sp. MSJ-9]MCI6304664.1 4-(cytidine 5'-diphospho)-2-C-methyl-D-erythritol kinase [Blautia sp.]MCI7450336.1 4-(cytidine 5'-diphospho)-2-C-methyl-D-erythritol kinase [Blautia sp.]MDD6413271.1 4-(cytidine 5'-diphospho)-2-C-methyl-D-erythritol kinase [Blautia sp.]MDY4116239.1 4-(cytidine 5'-diphospho)-2-C-methyl-D-erythritol k